MEKVFFYHRLGSAATVAAVVALVASVVLLCAAVAPGVTVSQNQNLTLSGVFCLLLAVAGLCAVVELSEAEGRASSAHLCEIRNRRRGIHTETTDDTAARIIRAAGKVARAVRRFGAAALRLLVRVLFMAVGLCSYLAVMFGAALIIPEVTPDGFAACMLLRIPLLFAVTGLWGFAWCWSVQHILPARLLDIIAGRL